MGRGNDGNRKRRILLYKKYLNVKMLEGSEKMWNEIVKLLIVIATAVISGAICGKLFLDRII